MAKREVHARPPRQHPNKRDARKEQRRAQGPIATVRSKAEGDSAAGGGLVFPGGDTAFKALLSARFCAAIWSHVSDCDETFNYWEPVHFLVFGRGLQTWEYSPQFALRSYAYLLVHATPAFIYHRLLQPNPLLIFYFVRCLLGLTCALAEVYFYKATCKEFGVHVGRLTLAFQIFSAGMFVSSAALLPSSWAMYATCAACAAWWHARYPLSIFFIALASLLGWPFAAALGVPIAFDIVILKRKYWMFVKWCAISAIAILGPMIAIDSSYYGKLVVAPWNLIRYNVLGGNGPELYGTEPLSYYLINGFLNFNIVWVCALLLPIALLLSRWLVPAKSRSTLSLPHALSLAPLPIWLAIFFFQPHKEERFLFPVYPLICLCGAVTVDVLQKLLFRLRCWLRHAAPGTHYLDCSTAVTVGVVMLSAALGVSRITALYRNYHAPLDLLMELGRSPAPVVADARPINLCIGKDWHRYPSSFFLPGEDWRVRLVRSEFRGILPQPYASGSNATAIVQPHFNDRNEEEPSAYFPESRCHLMLDLETGHETEFEPNYAAMHKRWQVVKSVPFLNVDKSHKFFRAFYIPFLSDRYTFLNNFHLLRAVRTKPAD